MVRERDDEGHLPRVTVPAICISRDHDSHAHPGRDRRHGGRHVRRRRRIRRLRGPVESEPLRKGLDTWYGKAEGKAAIDYAFHMIMTDVNDDTVKEMRQVFSEASRPSRCSWRIQASSSWTTGRSSAALGPTYRVCLTTNRVGDRPTSRRSRAFCLAPARRTSNTVASESASSKRGPSPGRPSSSPRSCSAAPSAEERPLPSTSRGARTAARSVETTITRANST